MIPAIDLKGGEVVRLVHGNPDDATVYDADPVAVAERWEAAGAGRLHVVDLDGALEGEPKHRDVITRIVSTVRMAVQVGGGVRTPDAIRAWLDAGASRVVVGTAALTDPEFLRVAVDITGDALVVALDSRNHELRLNGWKKGSGLDIVETAVRLAEEGVPRLLVTDIARDGTLTGPNCELVGEVAVASGVPVIASGGVATLENLRALCSLGPDGVEGVIIGRALYTGAVELTDALATVG